MSDRLHVAVVVALLFAGTSSVAAPLSRTPQRLAQAGPAAPTSPTTPPAAPGGPPAPGASEGAEMPKAEAPKTVIEKDEGQGILGKAVQDASGKELGRIVNVIIDRSSQPRAVVIDFGGFLGVGSRKIAVGWSALRLTPAEKPDRIVLDITRDQVKAAPEYKDGQPVVVLGPPSPVRSMSGGDTGKPEP